MFNQRLEHVMVMLPRTRTVALRFHPTPPQDWWSKCDVWARLSHIGVRMCAQLDPCAQFSGIRADVSGSLQAQTHSKMINICGFVALSAEKVSPRDYQYLSLGWGLSSSGRDLWPVAKPWPGCVMTANAWLSMWWYGGLINPSHAIASNRFYRSWLHGSWIFDDFRQLREDGVYRWSSFKWGWIAAFAKRWGCLDDGRQDVSFSFLAC